MMAACKLCGQLVTGRALQRTYVRFNMTDEDAKTGEQLQEFDAMGSAFVQHIGMRHPEQAQELAAVSNLSMKVYAMRQAQSSEQDFEPLRGAWETTIRLAIFGNPAQTLAEAPASGVSSSSSSSVPSGS